MSRWVPALFVLCALLVCADDLKKDRPQPKESTVEEVPPEEDTTLAVKEYSFNPLQAKKEVMVGNEYFKGGKYRAAAGRFREATKWDAANSEAWLRLGESEEKQKDKRAAKEAYVKYLEIAPDAKNAAEIRNKLKKLK